MNQPTTALDHWAVQDLRNQALAVFTHRDLAGQCWRDTRPMFDFRERSDVAIDVSRAALDHAVRRGLVELHPRDHHLFRFTHDPDQQDTPSC